MKSKIIQITVANLNSETGHYLYALCEDGTVWYCQPQNNLDKNIWYPLESK